MGIGTRIGGAGINLQSSNNISLGAGELYVIPSGTYVVQPGPFTFLQWFDPVAQLWRSVTNQIGRPSLVNSDGANWRLANLTGCAVGAVVTTAGSGYVSTSPPTVTPSAGGSTWTAIVGGAVNSSVTITTAGSNYTFPPVLIVSQPPTGGLQATMTCTISGGAINAVTVVNQGAGYTSVPTITVVNDPRDTTGSGGVLTPTLTGSGTITAVVCTNQGSPLTSVPTLSFSSGSAAATVVGCFTITGITVGTAGVAYGVSLPFGVQSYNSQTVATSVLANPYWQTTGFLPRPAQINGTTTAGAVITATGLVIVDGGLHENVPTVLVQSPAVATTAAAITATIGGVSDSSVLQPV
jgi:hypothetical protein